MATIGETGWFEAAQFAICSTTFFVTFHPCLPQKTGENALAGREKSLKNQLERVILT
jgi:hypothetical protein